MLTGQMPFCHHPTLSQYQNNNNNNNNTHICIVPYGRNFSGAETKILQKR